MRPLRYSINVTLDGCCDHREGIADEDLHRHAMENIVQPDALLISRAQTRVEVTGPPTRVAGSQLLEVQLSPAQARWFQHDVERHAAASRFRNPGDRVRVRRSGRGLLIEPVVTNAAAWFAELDRFASEPCMPERRQQPPTPERDLFE